MIISKLRDDGVSWNTISSVASGRVFRVENPGQDIMGCCRSSSWSSPELQYSAIPRASLSWGCTWLCRFDIFFKMVARAMKDGKTFAGDTICATQCILKERLCTSTQRDGNTYLYFILSAVQIVLSPMYRNSLITSNNDKKFFLPPKPIIKYH